MSWSAVPFLGYSRSLLYLVSAAYEEKPTNPIPGAPNEMPLAGMQRFVSKLPGQGAKFKIDLAAKTNMSPLQPRMAGSTTTLRR